MEKYRITYNEKEIDKMAKRYPGVPGLAEISKRELSAAIKSYERMLKGNYPEKFYKSLRNN